MDIIRDATTAITGTGGSVNSKTFTHTTVAALTGVYVAVFDDGGTNTVTGVTCDGVAMTQIMVVSKNGSSNIQVYLYGINGIAAGAHSIVVSRSVTSSDQILAGAVSYAGNDQAALYSVIGSNVTSSTSSVTGSVTTTAANSIALALAWADNRSISAGTGSTLLTANAGAVGQIALLESSTFPIASPGSYSMTANCSSGNSGIRLIAIAPAASAPAASPELLLSFI